MFGGAAWGLPRIPSPKYWLFLFPLPPFGFGVFQSFKGKPWRWADLSFCFLFFYLKKCFIGFGPFNLSCPFPNLLFISEIFLSTSARAFPLLLIHPTFFRFVAASSAAFSSPRVSSNSLPSPIFFSRFRVTLTFLPPKNLFFSPPPRTLSSKFPFSLSTPPL